jgi:hypothetical protein
MKMLHQLSLKFSPNPRIKLPFGAGLRVGPRTMEYCLKRPEYISGSYYIRCMFDTVLVRSCNLARSTQDTPPS